MLAKVKKHWIAILVLLLVVIDQIAKGVVIEFLKEESIVLIPNILTLKIVKNTGGAFGVGEGNVTIFCCFRNYYTLFNYPKRTNGP